MPSNYNMVLQANHCSHFTTGQEQLPTSLDEMSQTPDQVLAYKPNTRQIACLAKETRAAASAYAAASDNGS